VKLRTEVQSYCSLTQSVHLNRKFKRFESYDVGYKQIAYCCHLLLSQLLISRSSDRRSKLLHYYVVKIYLQRCMFESNYIFTSINQVVARHIFI